MFYQVYQYIKFLKKSTNQHGVHSPFVYNLVTKCFYDKTIYNEYSKIKNYKDRLKKDNSIIEIEDLGAGSRVFKTNKRKISEVLKNSSSTLKRAKLLFRISNYLKIKNALELGTNLGVGTHSLSLSNCSKVYTIEGAKSLFNFSKDKLKTFTKVNIHHNNFKDELTALHSKKWDLIFIDGHHDEKATVSYFEVLINNIHNDSVMIFDDIYWSKGMTKAWEKILLDPRVTLSIDTFKWGFLFFRKEQQKEHFTIRL